MSISGKIKTIDNKIEQNLPQYNLDRQNAKISLLSSRNGRKYELFTGEDVLPEKELLEKAASVKRFEHSLLGKELKKQPSVAEKQYQKFGNAFEFNKKEEGKTKKQKKLF